MCIALGLNPDIGLPLYALNIVADGIVLGLVFAYISTGLFKWTGSWLGGIGKYEDILTANAWACAPFLLQTVPITGSFFVFGEAMFAYPQNNTLILFITNSYLFTGWNLYILVGGLSVAQNISTGKALANVITGYIVFYATIYGITQGIAIVR